MNSEKSYIISAMPGFDDLLLKEMWRLYSRDGIQNIDRDILLAFYNEFERRPGLLESLAESKRKNSMKISKRQLKRIIKEEYSKLKRQGLIAESTRKRRRIISEGGVKNLLIEIEEILADVLESQPSGKITMEYAIDIIRMNFPEVFVNTSSKRIEDFISDYNDMYLDIYVDPISKTITLKK
jgi:hypothetical protein